MVKRYIWCKVCKGVMELNACDHEQSSEQLSIVGFKPYFCESHNMQINSPKEEAKMYKKFGSAPMGDNKRRLKQSEFVRKNREDIIADKYAKMNLKYPKGKNVTFDEKNHRFIPAHLHGR